MLNITPREGAGWALPSSLAHEVQDVLAISCSRVDWGIQERSNSPSGGISLTLQTAQQIWITWSSWNWSLQRDKATSPSGPCCSHLALVCVCTPGWSQPFAVTWDKLVPLPQLQLIKHKGSPPLLPVFPVCLTWKSYLVDTYFGLLQVWLCYKTYITPKPGSFAWSQTETWKKRYYGPLDKTSFVI